MPKKTIKAYPGGGQAPTQPLFLHSISVAHVYVNIATTTTDLAGRDLHQIIVIIKLGRPQRAQDFTT